MSTTSVQQSSGAESAPPPSPTPTPSFRQRLNALDVKVSPYLFISPFFILFILTGLFPLAYTAVVSVNEWGLIAGRGEFVGLQNYIDVLGQTNFLKALRNTFSIFLISSRAGTLPNSPNTAASAMSGSCATKCIRCSFTRAGTARRAPALPAWKTSS